VRDRDGNRRTIQPGRAATGGAQQGGTKMTRWLTSKLPSAVLLALLLMIAPVMSGAAMAAEDLEIIQAVLDGVPNVGNNRVVMGEVFARDG
jgi:hypothetical protein